MRHILHGSSFLLFPYLQTAYGIEHSGNHQAHVSYHGLPHVSNAERGQYEDEDLYTEREHYVMLHDPKAPVVYRIMFAAETSSDAFSCALSPERRRSACENSRP